MTVENRSATEFIHMLPSEYWDIRSGRREKIPTPLDDYGYVDSTRLIEDVKAVIGPALPHIPRGESDSHHMYWERSRYPNMVGATVNPHHFRILPTNQILVPRKFHEVIHQITEPPPVPPEKAMREFIEEQRAIVAIFQNARLAVRLGRKRYISEERLERGKKIILTNHYQRLDEALQLPRGIHLVDTYDLLPSNHEEMADIAHTLGRLALRRSVNRTNAVYAAAS